MGDGAPDGRDSIAPTPEQLSDEARVGATLAVAHPATTTSVAPTPEQLGDEARVGATLAVAHPESSTASFTSCEVASPLRISRSQER